MATPVYLEIGTKKVFACALDWPGWARAAKTEADALEALALYAGRYRPVAEEAGVRFPKSAGDNLDVVERVRVTRPPTSAPLTSPPAPTRRR